MTTESEFVKALDEIQDSVSEVIPSGDVALSPLSKGEICAFIKKHKSKIETVIDFLNNTKLIPYAKTIAALLGALLTLADAVCD